MSILKAHTFNMNTTNSFKRASWFENRQKWYLGAFRRERQQIKVGMNDAFVTITPDNGKSSVQTPVLETLGNLCEKLFSVRP